MRIERLALERYGHFTDHIIDLPGDEVRLYVLLGANEAGKTTALSALGDLLFGIEARSPFNFHHDYKQMRIGAVLRRADGQTLAIRRRKGNQNTLLDVNDRPLGDDALAPFLGSASRAVFDGLFGLTHASLRKGGDDMLAAEGDLGRMLFEAGSSMRNVTKALAALESEADQLFTAHKRAGKPFYLADKARIEAERDLRQATLTFDHWRQIDTERGQAEAEQTEARQRLDDLEARRARLERIRRVLSHLSELRQIEADLEALADAPLLPGDAGTRLDVARTRLTVARNRIDREQAAAAAAREGLAGLDIPKALLAAGDEVERLYERRGVILNNRTDLPGLRARRDVLVAILRQARSEIGRHDIALPGEPVLAEVRRLIEQDTELLKQGDDVSERRAIAVAELAAVKDELAAAPVPPDLIRLSLAVDQAQCLGDLEADLAAAEGNVVEAERRLEIALASLRLWSGDAAGLARLAVVERETVQRFERDLGEAKTRSLRARDAATAGHERLQSCERNLAALSGGEQLPTGEAVAAARQHRDLGWRLIRKLHFDAQAVSDQEVEAFSPRPRLAEAFEQAVRDSDVLADRRQAEAERLAKHAQLLADRDSARVRRAELDDAAAKSDAAVATLRESWQRLWLATGISPDPPREMDRWLDRREAVLHAWETAQAAARTLAGVRERHARERADLCAALERSGAAPCDGMSFAALLKEARLRLDDGRAVESARAILEERRKDQGTALQGEQARLDRLAGRRADWQQAWSSAMERIGLGADTLSAGAAVALAQWDKIRRDDDARAEIDQRIAGMERDDAAFAVALEALVATTLPNPTGGDPLVLVAETFDRLQTARQDFHKQRDLTEALRSAEAAAAAAMTEAAAAQDELDHLRAIAGCADDEALAEAIARAERKQVQIAALTELKRRIAAEADGLGLDEAIAEAAGRDPDAVRGEIASVKRDYKDLFAEAQNLAERVSELRRACADMEAGSNAAAAEQARRNALADMEECAERWMVTRTAAFLLRRGIEQFRQEQQGPLLAHAESLFSTLTLGSFTRFRIDYDGADKPVLLGIRADGAVCPVDGMSDGTRDQLFLALRLAAIERYLNSAEPLPFVADDLFVHFDDARAVAGLRALIDLGAKTQVLLFTHHRHLADLACQAGGDQQVRVLPLGADNDKALAPRSLDVVE